MTFGIEVLAFGPHPDDVELFCGGTLIRMADLGHRVGVVDLTRGEKASHGTPEERERECVAASRVLGLSHRENLRLPDAGLDAADPAQLDAVIECLRRLRPELVLAPWIEERHPDHVEAARLVTKAVFFAGVRKVGPVTPRFVPRQLLHYELRHRFSPTFVVDTSEAAARKREAIACYGSQVGRKPGEDPTLISSTQALDAIEARDRYRGSQIGASHGEALRAVSVPGLVDPVRHFRDNPFTEAHAFEPLP